MSSSSPTPETTDETPTQRQARLRRERREAKIKASGSSRLEKITQLSGRPTEPAPDPPSVTASTDLPAVTGDTLNDTPISRPSQQEHASQHDDPEEFDISAPEYQGRQSPFSQNTAGTGMGLPIEDDIRRLLRASGDPRAEAEGPRSEGGGGGGGGEDQDPLMAMLSQMMGMAPPNGPGQDPNSAAAAAAARGGMPPGMEALMGFHGTGAGGSAQAQAQSATKDNKGVWIWKVVHIVFAMLLGIYLTLHTAFASPLERTVAPSSSSQKFQTAGQVQHEQQQNVFWIFATTELLLQGTRYFLEQGNDDASGGWLRMIGGVLPEPYRGWVRLAGRYSGIWATVVEDGMVVIWVLGVGRWLMAEIGR